jgi:hypothetical protein
LGKVKNLRQLNLTGCTGIALCLYAAVSFAASTRLMCKAMPRRELDAIFASGHDAMQFTGRAAAQARACCVATTKLEVVAAPRLLRI